MVGIAVTPPPPQAKLPTSALDYPNGMNSVSDEEITPPKLGEPPAKATSNGLTNKPATYTSPKGGLKSSPLAGGNGVLPPLSLEMEKIEEGEPLCPRPFLEEAPEAGAGEALSPVVVPRPFLEEAPGSPESGGLTTPPPTTPQSFLGGGYPSTLLPEGAVGLQGGRRERSFSGHGLLSPQRSPTLSHAAESPMSCRSCVSSAASSTADFHLPNQTIIIFDWDDTLCPSTQCMRTHGLSVFSPVPERLKPDLERIANLSKAVLEQAMQRGKVVIVTNGESGWVELSCKAWLPSLESTVELIDVVSARSTWEPFGVRSPAGWKQRTFQSEIEKFYSRYLHQTWKNIISIGDAPHEREALRRVTWCVTHSPKLRPKSIKFTVRPTMEQLSRELEMLRLHLSEIVCHNDQLDLQFDEESLGL